MAVLPVEGGGGGLLRGLILLASVCVVRRCGGLEGLFCAPASVSDFWMDGGSSPLREEATGAGVAACLEDLVIRVNFLLPVFAFCLALLFVSFRALFSAFPFPPPPVA